MVEGRPALVIFMDDKRISAWLDGKFTKIGVGVTTEMELLALHQEAQAKGMISTLIQDSGLTEFGGIPTYTAVAVGPDENSAFEGLTDGLKLL